MQRWTASAVVVAVGVAGLAGCQPEGAFFTEVRTDGVQVSNRWEPIAGDFDGDGHGDVLWTAVDRPDQLWRGQGGGTFAKTPAPQDIGAEYDPVVGDFGGDEADDILWYAGAYPAYVEESRLWIMGGAGGGVAEEVVVELPMYADRRDPVLLPDADSRDGVVLSLRQDDLVAWDADDVHGGTTVALPYSGWGDGVQPRTGDFDGDGNGDIYVTIRLQPDHVIWGDGAGGFTPAVVRDLAGGYHDIHVLELDGDGRDDIAFVGDSIEGPIPPVNVWFGRADRAGFDRKTLPGFPHRGTVEVHRDTSGHGTDSLVRYGDDQVTAMRVDTARTGHLMPSNPVALGPWNQYDRLVGEYGQGGAEDVLVSRRGGGTDHLLLTGEEQG